MHKKIWMALGMSFCTATLLISGCCGDVEEKLNKCNKNLKETMAKLDSEQANSTQLARLLKGTKEKLQVAKEENGMLTKRLEALGQDVAVMKRKGQMTAEEKARLAKRLATVKKQMQALKARQAQAEARVQQYKNLLKKFQEMIKSGKINVTVRDGRLVVQLSEKILFESGRARLKKDGKKALSDVTAILKQVPNRNFQVAGHTDNVAISTRRFRSNWELSTARAVNVVKFMQKEGLDPKRLSAAGYSQYSTVSKNDTPEGRAQNRRIEIVLQPNLSELPSLHGVVDK